MEVFLSSFIPLVLIIQTLQVQGQAPGILLEPEMENSKLTMGEGDSFTVGCTLSDQTPEKDSAVFKWFDEGGAEVIRTQSGTNPFLRQGVGKLSLGFRSLKKTDVGKFKCEVTTDSGKQYEKEFTLELKVSVKVTDCKTEQNGLIGTEQRIKCIASAGGPLITVDWEFNHSLISPDDARFRKDATSLVILNVTTDSEGTYSFIGKLAGVSQDKIVDIQFKAVEVPRFKSPNSSKTAIVGNKVQMFCTATGRPIPSEIDWKKEGDTNTIGTSGRVYTTDGTRDANGFQKILTIDDVKPEDKGKYICTAHGEKVVNGDTEKKLEAIHTATLEVQIPPTVTFDGVPKGTEGTGAEMLCTAFGDPAPHMSWQIKGTGKQYIEGETSERITVEKSVEVENNNKKVTFTLRITKVQMSDAGTYICKALNKAGSAEKEAEFIVEYGPKFIDPQTQFYTWRPRVKGEDTVTDLTCKSNGNPPAVYEWHKDGVLMASTSTETDKDDEHISTSTLRVSYTGSNNDVIGEYKCKAKNHVNTSEVSIMLAIADVPPTPSVQMYDDEANHFIFWLKVDNVVGPPVETFKVNYTEDADRTVPVKSQEVGIENRPILDSDRQYTEIKVEGLKETTAYTFNFYAMSPAGQSNAKELKLVTPEISAPSKVKILTPINVDTVTYILVRWEKPSSGGADINYYEIKYIQAVVDESDGLANDEYVAVRTIGQEKTITNIAGEQYKLTSLIPNTFYRINVYAHNVKGNGAPGQRIIKTAEASPVPGSSTGEEDGLSTGAIIGIVIAIFFILLIIVDVTCYLKNNCGILMSIKEKVTGSRGEEGYSAAKTDDVENLAKKDELTEEAKAAEEGEVADMAEEEKKEPLLSEEQKVDTVDEGETPAEKKELDPDEKEAKKEEERKAEETPAEDKKEEAPANKETAPAEEKPAEEKPAEEKPAE